MRKQLSLILIIGLLLTAFLGNSYAQTKETMLYEGIAEEMVQGQETNNEIGVNGHYGDDGGGSTTNMLYAWVCNDPSYPINCNNGYCCPSSKPICGTGSNTGYCYSNTTTTICPDSAPMECYGNCCPSDRLCGSDGSCIQLPSNTTTTTTAPVGGGIGAACGTCAPGLICATGPGGYCTKSCSSDADCGQGAYCYAVTEQGQEPQNLCFAACSTNADCRNGYTCMGDPGALICIPEGSSSTTTVPPSSTTTAGGNTTTTAGGNTTTTAGGNTENTFIVAVNINGDDQQDAPESSGTLPGVSPSIITSDLFKNYFYKKRIYVEDRFFPPLDPAFIQQYKSKIAKQLKAEDFIKIAYIEEEQKSFWVKDDKDKDWRQVSATNRKSGVNCDIFVDDTLTVSGDIIELYAKEFDEVMFDIVTSNFGSSADIDKSGKLSILLYAINEDTSKMTTLGYFWLKDFFPDAEIKPNGLRSNEMDMICIRGNAPDGWVPSQDGDWAKYPLSTLIHEYQHLVNFCVTFWVPPEGKFGTSAVWTNEMMSMAAQTMYFKKKISQNPSFTDPRMLGKGYLDRIEDYNNDPGNFIRNGQGLTFWDYEGNPIPNYALSYLFGQYLAIHSTSGDGIFKEILDYMVANAVFDYKAVAAVAAQRVPGITSWEDLLKNWALANMANQPSGPYGYNGQFTLTPHGPTSNNVNIHNGGVVYRNITGPLTVPPDAGPNIRYFSFADVNSATTTTIQGGTSTTTTAGGNTTTTTPPDGECPADSPVDCSRQGFPGGCCPHDYPICCTDFCCPQDKPVCGSDGTCKAECIFSRSLDNQQHIGIIRSLRDSFITNKDGPYLTDMYYRNATEISRIIENDPVLKKRFVQLAGENISIARHLTETKKAMIAAATMQKVVSFLKDLQGYGSKKLQADIAMIINGLEDGSLLHSLGVTVDKTSESLIKRRYSVSKVKLKKSPAGSSARLRLSGYVPGTTVLGVVP